MAALCYRGVSGRSPLCGRRPRSYRCHHDRPESVPSFTFSEHLRLEQISERRHEWVAGTVDALSGGRERHALLSLILYRLLADTARRERCRAFHADRMIRTSDAAYYPDVMVVCGPAGNRRYETDASW